MITAHWVASLVPQPNAWYHCGHGKKDQISMEWRLSVSRWHDMALRSPAPVEAQLRVILRAKTSYRSRCLLDTYWKDNFWPHEFKVVKCLERYVDVWKRFICYVFRVQHFQTHQQQDIYNLRLGSDQTIMIRHVLEAGDDYEDDCQTDEKHIDEYD
ncbi:hypothetical protein FCULG_00011852 [Fusarium culmorum]|uniref:Uncharacterized protein n=1 Tax=Fusarium culmorum TaxID=5516 RepID=A0A2T4GSA6_FUSCU|nr:hypothetical protein FCULG_00011852 [Fusarium culmorum]